MKKTSIISYFKILSELSKFKITLAVTITSSLGYILASDHYSWQVFAAISGLFFVACGSAVLNHFQEYTTDAQMNRTARRPIPSGKISPQGAFVLSLVYVLVGSALLLIYGGYLAMLLSLLALIWYNAIYTPLKKRTAFAVIPGSVIGAIPPIVGWVVGGGSLADPKILMLAFFMFIWQIPHFWLLMLHYSSDYEKAGFPVITNLYTQIQLKNITFVWTLATAISGLLIPLYGIAYSPIAIGILFFASLILIFLFAPLLWGTEKKINFIRHFTYINTYLLVIIFTLVFHDIFK